MKKRFNKLSALLVLGLLLLGMSLACYVWVYKSHRQYKLNRDLIAALLNNNTKQALVLVDAGADPSTEVETTPAPSLLILIKQLLHPAPHKPNTSRTAFLIACGLNFFYLQENALPQLSHLSPLDPQLTQAMLRHGANINAKGIDGSTALHTSVIFAIFDLPEEYKTNKEIIQQLLANGADPDEEEKPYTSSWGSTPLKSALHAGYSNLAPILISSRSFASTANIPDLLPNYDLLALPLFSVYSVVYQSDLKFQVLKTPV